MSSHRAIKTPAFPGLGGVTPWQVVLGLPQVGRSQGLSLGLIRAIAKSQQNPTPTREGLGYCLKSNDKGRYNLTRKYSVLVR